MADSSISIIIPAYNVEKYLEAALKSIEAQDQFPDEVILIDDGSTDRTLELAQSHTFPFPYEVVSIENGGQGNARNLGASRALSEYLYFFDADDLLVKGFIASIKKQISRNKNPDIVLFSGESFNDSEYQGDRWLDYRRGFSGYFADRESFLDQAYSKKGLSCSPCLYVSRKSLWGPKVLEFGSTFMEDDAIFYPLLFSCNSFSVIDDVLFLRRNRQDSTMTMTPNEKHVEGALNCMHTTMRLCSSPDLTHKERWHIRKRLESNCTVYIVTAKKAGLPVQASEVIGAISKSKSVGLALKSLLYGVGADQSYTARSIVGALKRARSLARR